MKGFRPARAAAALAVVIALGTSLAAASPAQAAPKPQQEVSAVNLSVPRYVAIKKRQTFLNPTINCPEIECIWDNPYRATWTAYASGKAQETIIFSPYDMVPHPTLQVGGYVQDTDRIGNWRWTPVSDGWSVLPQNKMNSPLTDVRLGSNTSLAATRKGIKVTLKIGAANYRPSKHNWVAYSTARGLVQARKVGTTNWYNLREIHPDSAGWETWSYYTSVVKEYRAYLYTTPTIWGSQSPNRKA